MIFRDESANWLPAATAAVGGRETLDMSKGLAERCSRVLAPQCEYATSSAGWAAMLASMGLARVAIGR